MTQPNFVAAYIVDLESQKEPFYLLLRRSEQSYLPGIWQIVTGKIEHNESASLAVVREINEETSLSCTDLYSIDVTMFYEQTKNHIAFSANFCAYANINNVVSLSKIEHDRYQWCTFIEAFELLAFPSQKETLKFIHQFYVLQKPNPVNKVQKLF